MKDPVDPSRALASATVLQLGSIDLLRHSAELRRRTDLARERFDAGRRRLMELKRRLELVR